MTIQGIYEEYKHLDYLLSDKKWFPDTQVGKILYDLWQTIKGESKRRVK